MVLLELGLLLAVCGNGQFVMEGGQDSLGQRRNGRGNKAVGGGKIGEIKWDTDSH